MRDIRDYAVMNDLGDLVPVVNAACTAVEQGLRPSEKEKLGLRLSPLEAGTKLAAARDEALCFEEKHFRPLSNLKRLSGRPNSR